MKKFIILILFGTVLLALGITLFGPLGIQDTCVKEVTIWRNQTKTNLV